MSLAWFAAFAAGRATDHVYAWLAPTAAVSMALALWRDPALRARCRPTRVVVEVGIGVVVGAASLVATYVAFPIAASWVPSLTNEVRELYVIAGVAPATLVGVVIVATAEEVIWRGALMGALRERGAVVSVVVAAVVYAAAQAGAGSPWLVFAALSFGTVWGALTWWRQSLVASWIAHLIWTLVVLGLHPLLSLEAVKN